MYYNPDYINWGPQGWICPKCGRVMSPTQPYCLFCSDNQATVYNYHESVMLDQVINDALARIKEKPNNE